MKNNSVLALITARGGSKRLPGKNVAMLGDTPLIGWSIGAACSCSHVHDVIVSTDDKGIASTSRQCGAEVPFLRPVHLAGDTASHYDVIAHALDWLEEQDRLPHTCVLLQPTSPFRTSNQLEEALEQRIAQGAESLISVKSVHDHPQFMFRKNEEGQLFPYHEPKQGYQRSQDQEALFMPNGAIFIFDVAAFRNRQTVLAENPHAYFMDTLSSVDIDTKEDLELCHAILALRQM